MANADKPEGCESTGNAGRGSGGKRPSEFCGDRRANLVAETLTRLQNGTSLLAVIISCLLIEDAMAETRPNIILLMSDDQGFVNIGYNTNNDPGIQTPNISQMAQEGLEFLVMENPHQFNIAVGPGIWPVGFHGTKSTHHRNQPRAGFGVGPAFSSGEEECLGLQPWYVLP